METLSDRHRDNMAQLQDVDVALANLAVWELDRHGLQPIVLGRPHLEALRRRIVRSIGELRHTGRA